MPRLEDKYPSGTFFTLPPKYTLQNGAILRIEVPLTVSVSGSSRLLISSVHTYWPDGGYRYYPSFFIWDESDINVIIDPRNDQEIALRVLAWSDEKTVDGITFQQVRNRIMNLVRIVKHESTYHGPIDMTFADTIKYIAQIWELEKDKPI